MGRHADFLVIGGGLAGLTFARRASRHGSVLVLGKKQPDESASDRAQGGIAAVLSAGDSFESHAQDTFRAGAGLCNPEVVRTCIAGGPAAVQELIDLGAPFSRAQDAGGQGFDLGKEGGHSQRRILHAGDFTGHEVMATLLAAARSTPGITLLDHLIAVNLIVEPAGGGGVRTCRGVYALDQRTGRVETFTGGCTVLATGGAGKVYVYTSNPDVATGDGMAMAYRAGAELANLEFVQFHPTCLYHRKAKSFLLSEAMRGEGGKLRLLDGQEFMQAYDPRGALATRDVVTRAIDRELKKRGDDCVLLDMTGLAPDFLTRRFPNIHQQLLAYGIDMTREPIQVVPAAHYFCGGVRTDLAGRTSIPGLYAVGETACTGLHGANRLASNSLLEALVFGRRAAEDAVAWLPTAPVFPAAPREWDPGDAVDADEMVVVAQNWDEIRRSMWNYVGIVRSTKRLERALRRVQMIREEIQEFYWDFLLTSDLVELRNLAQVAELVIHAARLRKESRGLHFTLDHPQPDDAHWVRDTVLQLGPRGAPVAVESPLPYGWP
ncbi:MAG TPA: L-aspartate oxidase [Myxococcota bacterium]|nr:L-aspartate oxidase [Myxococcota bacterium]HRY96286.1 L-aspartate oxidase [Myxococcota bacterium]